MQFPIMDCHAFFRQRSNGILRGDDAASFQQTGLGENARGILNQSDRRSDGSHAGSPPG